MKNLLLLLCFMIIAQFTNGQTTLLKANRVKVTGEEHHKIFVRKDPIQFRMKDSILYMEGSAILGRNATYITLEDGTKKAVNYIFDKNYMKSIVYFNDKDRMTKVILVSLDGISFCYYEKLFKI